MEKLKEYPLRSLSKGSSTYDFYSKIFAENGLKYAPDTEVATADLILPLVKNNLGIGFLPKNLVESDIESGEIFKLNLKRKFRQDRFVLPKIKMSVSALLRVS